MNITNTPEKGVPLEGCESQESLDAEGTLFSSTIWPLMFWVVGNLLVHERILR